MLKVFLSYRREDTPFEATAIHEKLCEQFGDENVFMDVDTIPVGQDFRHVIRAAVFQCDVLLATIGDEWLMAVDEHGTRRLENPTDFVRIEIEAALERNVPVVPLLIGDCSMPSPAALPASLQDLAYRHAFHIRAGRDFKRDTDELGKQIRRTIQLRQREAQDASRTNEIAAGKELANPQAHAGGGPGADTVAVEVRKGSEQDQEVPDAVVTDATARPTAVPGQGATAKDLLRGIVLVCAIAVIALASMKDSPDVHDKRLLVPAPTLANSPTSIHTPTKTADKPAVSLRKTCDAGNGGACTSLGYMYRDGHDATKNAEQAVTFFRKACDAGNNLGCANLGYMYRNGTGVARDTTQAGALFSKACDAHEPWGCIGLAFMYRDGTGVAKDTAQAIGLFQKACDAGKGNACTSLGYMYRDGTGVAKDAAKASALVGIDPPLLTRTDPV